MDFGRLTNLYPCRWYYFVIRLQHYSSAVLIPGRLCPLLAHATLRAENPFVHAATQTLTNHASVNAMLVPVISGNWDCIINWGVFKGKAERLSHLIFTELLGVRMTAVKCPLLRYFGRLIFMPFNTWLSTKHCNFPRRSTIITDGWMLNELKMLNRMWRSAGTEQRGGSFLIPHL